MSTTPITPTRVTDYDVVTAARPDAFSALVAAAIAGGKQPIGDPVRDTATGVFAQAVGTPVAAEGWMTFQAFAATLTPPEGFPMTYQAAIDNDDGETYTVGAEGAPSGTASFIQMFSPDLVVGTPYQLRVTFSHFEEELTEVDPPDAAILAGPYLEPTDGDVLASTAPADGYSYAAFAPNPATLDVTVRDASVELGVAAGLIALSLNPSEADGGYLPLRYAVFQVHIRPTPA